MTKETISKFGKVLRDFRDNPNIAPLFRVAYEGLKKLKQNRINKAMDM